VMSSKYIRTDLVLAWPTAEVAVMGADGAINILYSKQLSESSAPDEERAKLVQEYKDTFSSPYISAASGHVDDVITPAETRPRLIAALELLRDKRSVSPDKKHGNIPL
jgi:acetyl-CoA carboxylase carboxyltransferase component